MHALRDLLTLEDLPEPAEPARVLRRRRLVIDATLAGGTLVLGATLAARRGSLAFTLLGFLTAGVWTAGSAAAGPLHQGEPTDRAQAGWNVLAAVVLGFLAFVDFLGASLVARRVPGLGDAVDSVLARADAGPAGLVLAIAVLNAVAEERFFRGALPPRSSAITGRRSRPRPTCSSRSPRSTSPSSWRQPLWAACSCSSGWRPGASSLRRSPT